ncbi:Nucleotide-binding universal stress protein, UspA family [Micromonospora pattaloongensis]|uniref:Nucleotide-binding universal stress protein, UspA family n=1 Tax=Micromonospora pattaloongensis TaxID=405436 RepID=A0A1H3RWM8_9ACTN|nr:universal stress protein [Micromonospora pattaloongensis]SDZ29661.1 Nucleotide-binding universal stress protein, UspA family [Micromonospora pattaloongensis]
MGAARGTVVGVDGSGESLDAVRWAARRARAVGDPLRLVYGYSPPMPVPTMPVLAVTPDVVPEEYIRAADDLLATAADAARGAADGVEVSTEAVLGGPARVLVEASGRAALVVIGSRGRGGFAGLLLGSVGVQVSGHARCPTAVVRGEEHPGGVVVVGVDGSEPSHAALRFGFAEAAWRRVPVLAVHAWQRPTPLSLPEATAAGFSEDFDPASVERRARATATDALAPLRAQFPEVEVREQVIEASPPGRLVEASRDAALVVVGSRGRGGFAGLLLGSTSQGVLQHAECPVVVTRTAD